MMMPGGGFGWGFGIFGMLLMLVFWGLIIVGIALVVGWAIQQGRRGGGASPEGDSALEILKKRYARGEIGQEEFEAKKRDLL